MPARKEFAQDRWSDPVDADGQGGGTAVAGVSPAKERFIQQVFNRIAGHYDSMNLLMTMGLWRYWQRAFRQHAGIMAGDRILDVGCGTADLSLIMAAEAGPQGRVTGLDLSEEMLAVGRRKVLSSPYRHRVRLVQGNAMAIPFADDSFDVVASGFTLRNVASLDRVLAEMVRVVRPGGRVLVLELSHPRSPLVRGPYLCYFEHILPRLGFWARRDNGRLSPYAWLPESLKQFPDADGLARRLERVGLEQVHYHCLTGGIVCIHQGRKP